MTTITTLRFPELRLPMREGHRLRGYFGRAFKDVNPLLHNHLEDGATRQGYPVVQYKVIEGTPTVVGVNDGSRAVTELFADTHEIVLGGTTLPGDAKELQRRRFAPEFLTDRLVEYEFLTPYCPLNQDTYPRYREAADDAARHAFISHQLVGHLLMACRGLDYLLENDQRLVAFPHFGRSFLANLKNTRLTAFRGTFVTNVLLPDLIGIGKSSSRGFGTIVRTRPGIALPPPARGGRRRRGEEE